MVVCRLKPEGLGSRYWRLYRLGITMILELLTMAAMTFWRVVLINSSMYSTLSQACTVLNPMSSFKSVDYLGRYILSCVLWTLRSEDR